MTTGFTRKQTAQIRLRDDNQCVWHGASCGGALVVHHRANRGMGGSKSLNVLPNGLLVCAEMNQLFESDARTARVAYGRGIKLPRNGRATPELIPVRYPSGWFLLVGATREPLLEATAYELLDVYGLLREVI